MSLMTPTKPSKKAAAPLVIDDEKLEFSPQSQTDELDEEEDLSTKTLDELRTRFVGDVNLPESTLSFRHCSSTCMVLTLPLRPRAIAVGV